MRDVKRRAQIRQLGKTNSALPFTDKVANKEGKGGFAYLALFWRHAGSGSSAFRFADRGAKLGFKSLDGRRGEEQDGGGDGGDDGRRVVVDGGRDAWGGERTRYVHQSHKGVGRSGWTVKRNDPAGHLTFTQQAVEHLPSMLRWRK